MSIPVSKIRAVLIEKNNGKKLAEIKDTPHYQFCSGIKEPYIEYLRYARQPDHSVEQFQELIDNFEYSKIGKVKLEKINGDYIIRDGLHRIAILVSLGFKTI